ncbi:unnamed protein product [Vitrella brassicaformis CCMP3155]|uniref:Uncharacterized protein n=1 Tax=Vitrella brassicaformis (strain CCMP3155) TaxID=1169540 RepID=A0A0G4GNZ3_VITBC|nr:unnamed protein product [Vitrella brassicaformis CCMP3155]|eukprot:CEM32001.1 unnamed protein product [Vitrella brassicaformis CCMP3155]
MTRKTHAKIPTRSKHSAMKPSSASPTTLGFLRASCGSPDRQIPSSRSTSFEHLFIHPASIMKLVLVLLILLAVLQPSVQQCVPCPGSGCSPPYCLPSGACCRPTRRELLRTQEDMPKGAVAHKGNAEVPCELAGAVTGIERSDTAAE